MNTNPSPSKTHPTAARRGLSLALAVAAVAALGACTGNPGAGSAAYKEGVLGNGSFVFACDDGIACRPYSNDADKFPKAIASGSNFDVRFVPKGQEGNALVLSDGRRYEGIKTTALAPYVEPAGDGDGFAAVKAGFGTVLARDSRGTIVDYVTLTIVQPDTLIVYDANYDGGLFAKPPPQLEALNMNVDDRGSYRVVAGYARAEAAGSIPVDWSSDDPTVVQIESYSGRVVNVIAKKAGNATLTAKGAGVIKTVPVEVK